ncbi:HIT domain-containing protein [Candidatus Woesearchaeota archaeon]|nr:HIT domain-containing protein [Candidatus Woesearchaeota archaeon]
MPDSEFDSMSQEEIAEYQRQNCVFCKIVKGDIPSKKVYEDDKIICILDINPAAKGHLLVLTKEHYPILPLIPPDVARHMFRTTKHLSKSLKEAMICPNATVFIANGAVAGQQSPHFLYHIIPRENNDGLDNFNIPSKEFSEEEVKGQLAAFKGKIGLMMRQLRAQRQSRPGEAQAPGPRAPAHAAAPSPESQKSLAEMIDKNPQMKQMIIETPEAFKKEIEMNPELKALFAGININKLSEALKNIKA